MTGAGNLVSVVIPCFNQGRYLQDAIGSARTQAHAPVEVIVVDDGSAEDLQSVVRAWPEVHYVRQRNRGVAAARNHGLARSRGAYVVFLDADDRLAPGGLVDGLAALDRTPDAGAAIGLARIIEENGMPVAFEQHGPIDPDPYRELLRSNFIWMPAQVLYRVDVVRSLGGFDRRVNACADYDLYLRMARACRLALHGGVVAEYRRHAANMSGDAALMLSSVLRVLERQRPYTNGKPAYEEAQAAGREFWRRYYGAGVVEQIRRARTASPVAFIRPTLVLMRHDPAAFATHLKRHVVRAANAVLRRRPINVP